MAVIAFLLEELMRARRGDFIVVCGRCVADEFGVGDTFTQLWWEYAEWDAVAAMYVTLDAGNGADVALRVQEIGYYNGTIDRLGYGHTAGLRLVGDGLELLEKLDFGAEMGAHRQWTLRG